MEPEKNDACDKQERRLTAADAFLALLVARYFKGCAEFRDRIGVLFGLRTRRADARARLMNPTQVEPEPPADQGFGHPDR